MGVVKIRDVALAAGVSVGTASRVLSGHPATSIESRRRVTEAAKALGYRANAQARSLRKASSSTIGVLVPDIRNPFFADIAQSAERRALAAGFAMLLGNADESIDQQDHYLELLYAQRVAGIVVAPQGDGSGVLSDLLALGVVIVFVDRVVEGVEVPHVTSDNRSGITEAVVHLADLGHRRVGLVAGPQQTSTGRERRAAFCAAVEDFGLDDDSRLIVSGDYQADSGARGATALLDLPRAPTAIIAADSLMTFGVLEVLHDRGIVVGQELSVIGYDDVAAYRWLRPALTVIAHDPARMGVLSVDLVLDALAGRPARSVILDASLVVRQSTAPPPR